ncbi:MAG: SRPBCC family protein [Bryobacteraceae bacterium]
MTSPVAVREAFAVFENPYNLARITPPWLNFKILTTDLRMGLNAEIDYEFRWLGIPLRWKTRITEYEPPFHFVDEALKSPYLLWRHHHSFRPSPEGTVISDRVDYRLRFGVFGRAAHWLIVRRQLNQIFDYRQKAIAEMLRSAAPR